MKGKKAAQAANRRATEASATVEELRAELARERADHKKVVHDLETEIRRLRAEHLSEAGRIAAKEVERRLAEVEEERRRRGMSEDLAYTFMYQKDKFILNACRYVSMTTGVPPMIAFERVMTWCIDDDFAGVTDPIGFCLKIGVPIDGWVARYLNKNKFLARNEARSAAKANVSLAISLDRAENEGHPEIHPKYKSWWYPKHIEYGSLEIVDEKPENDE